MTTFSRTSPGRPPRRRHAYLRAALVLATAVASLMAVTAPAGAVISGSFGLQVREPRSLGAKTLEVAPLQYHGGPVLHSSDAYVIYWDPGHKYRPDWERLIDKYFQNVGADSGSGNLFAVDGQYVDATGSAANQSTFRGSYTDSNPYPTSAEGGNCTEPAVLVCLTDQQIKAEIQHVITSVAPPLPGATGTPIYYLLTPPGVNVCTDKGSPSTCSNSAALEKEVETLETKKAPPPANTGICGYHSVANPESATPIPYVVQPWVAGTAGLYLLGEQEGKIVTSPSTVDVPACQDYRQLEEPNQLPGVNPFGNYAEGLADVIINDLSTEQRNVVVDPYLNGWYQTKTAAEQGDFCQYAFGLPAPVPPANEQTHAGNTTDETISSGNYYLPWSFDSVAVIAGQGIVCWQGVTNEPYFTAPNPVNAGDIIGLNSESNVTLDVGRSSLPADEPYLRPLYTWDYGDGTGASGPEATTEFHSYQYGGKYKVTLTIKDSGGNVAQSAREITVVGPPPPAPAAETPAASTSTSAATSSTPPPPPAVPTPLATAAILSHSLKTVVRKGLAVRYSVNEQVAGRFEVMVSSAVAKRLGLSGAPATGLPAGSSGEVVIAKAILVTTKGGRSIISIPLSKRNAGRLGRTRKLTLTLRLIVRNAASHAPASTTVVTAATLTH